MRARRIMAGIGAALLFLTSCGTTREVGDKSEEAIVAEGSRSSSIEQSSGVDKKEIVKPDEKETAKQGGLVIAEQNEKETAIQDEKETATQDEKETAEQGGKEIMKQAGATENEAEKDNKGDQENGAYQWILDTSSKLIHRPSCPDVADIPDADKEGSNEDIADLREEGYLLHTCFRMN